MSNVLELINNSELITKFFLAPTTPTVNDDSDAGLNIGQVWLDTSTSKFYLCVDDTVGAAVWTQTALITDIEAINDLLSETVNINNQENGAAYVTVGYYLYAGSTTKNISKIEIGSQRNNTTNTYDLRVIDITNANIIAEANALNSGAGVEVVNDLGAISNLPTTPTVLEIQAKRDNTNPGATVVFVRSAKFTF